MVHHTALLLLVHHASIVHGGSVGGTDRGIHARNFFATRVATVSPIGILSIGALLNPLLQIACFPAIIVIISRPIILPLLLLTELLQALAHLFHLEALLLLVIERQTARSRLLGQRVHSDHISLGQVVLMFDSVFDQVLELFHLYLHNVLIHIRVAGRDHRRFAQLLALIVKRGRVARPLNY